MPVTIELGGKVRRLRYDFNAIADLEAEANAGIGTLLVQERIGFNTIRLLIWAGIKHAERGLTIQKVGDMLQEYIAGGGDVAKPMEQVTRALEESGLWAKTDEGNAETGAAN